MPMLSLIAIALTAALPGDSVMWQMSDAAYANPALKQWMLPGSYSAGGVQWADTAMTRAIDPRLGSGERAFSANAGTYLKHKSSTLWGSASYANGRQYGLRWNETSDATLLWPYLTADSVGGNMRLERYAFSGGYADNSGRWAWGIAGGYAAGLYYRNVDPRPRNVTGRLDITAGASYSVSSAYDLALSAGWSKYKQSNSVQFMSEMGEDRIYHLTGPVMHYRRFDGQGKSASYNGHFTRASLSLFRRSGDGLSATADWQRFTFTKILVDLNRLPLARMADNSLGAQIAWKHPGLTDGWAVTVSARMRMRRGTENIFGDPAGSVYPQIGSVQRYRLDSYDIRLSGLWQYHPGSGLRIWVKPEAALSLSDERYLSPLQKNRINAVRGGAEARISMPLGTPWRLWVHAKGAYTAPFGCELLVSNAGDTTPGLLRVQRQAHEVYSHSSAAFGAGAGLIRSLSRRLALQLALDWSQSRHTAGHRTDTMNAAISLLF